MHGKALFADEQAQWSSMPSANCRSKCLYISWAASNALVNVVDPRPVSEIPCRRYLKRGAGTLCQFSVRLIAVSIVKNISLGFLVQWRQVLRYDDALQYKDRLFGLFSRLLFQHTPGGGLFHFLYLKCIAEGFRVLFVPLVSHANTSVAC